MTEERKVIVVATSLTSALEVVALALPFSCMSSMLAHLYRTFLNKELPSGHHFYNAVVPTLREGWPGLERLRIELTPGEIARSSGQLGEIETR